jgi:hypothetical protein
VAAVLVRPVLSRVTDTCTVAQAGGSDSATPRAPTVTACALRLKPDVITQLITKYEARQRKIADHLLNRGTSNKYHFAERFRGNLTEFLESAGGLDALLAVDAVGSKDMAVGANTLALQSVLLLLRRHGIRVSDRPHQLQGASQGFQQHLEPSLAATLCAELGVPFVVILHPDAGNKITLQYCGDHATTASAAHSAQQQQQPQSVPLPDLPHVLQECLRVVRSGEGKFSLYLTVQAALTEAAVVRSPNRASSAAASAASGASAAVGTGEGHAHSTAGGKSQKVRFGSFDIKNPTTMANINTSESCVDSPTPAALKHGVEKVVHVVTLDGRFAAAGHGKDWQQFNNPKDKKQAVIKRKEYEQAPQRIRTLLMQAYSTMMLATAGAVSEITVPNFTPLNRATAAPYIPGAVVLVDAPYALLRHLCTILMTKLHSPVACSSAREEYEGLPNTALLDSLGYSNSAGNSGAYRRTLKQLMFLLISYAKQVTSGVTSTGAGTASGAQHSVAGGGKGSSSGATTPSAGTPHGHAHGHSTHGAHGGAGSVGAAEKSGGGVASGQGVNTGQATLLQVHLYSVGDQQMDMLVCDAKALLGAKFA